jgi:hypothetical protein
MVPCDMQYIKASVRPHGRIPAIAFGALLAERLAWVSCVVSERILASVCRLEE